MTTAEALAAGRKLIDTPEKWCKGSYAMTKRRRAVGPLEPTAACFCAAGACLVVTGDLWNAAREALDRQVSEHFCGGTATTFNDHHLTTHADVMALFDRAIAAEKGKVSQ